MKDQLITGIIRPTRFVGPDDSAARAAGLIRTAQLPGIPVLQDGQIVGIVTERSLLTAAERANEIRIADIMEHNPGCASAYLTVGQAAEIMSSTGSEMLGVVNEYGGFLGIVTRSDVLAAEMNLLKPPSIAGMATPIGVHLTTGATNGGAGSFGLFLTGIAMSLMMVASQAILVILAILADKLLGTHIKMVLRSPMPTQLTWRTLQAYIINYGFAGLSMLFLLALLRLSPMSGYHAAEHQVVHAVEAGEQLDPAIVRQMPRVHPRCGTNLLAGAMIFMILDSKALGDTGIMIALVAAVLWWRKIGYYLQQYVTTKPASPRQIQSGIKAGEELLAKFQREPNKTPDGWMRIWNMGLIQVALGFTAVYQLSQWLLPKLGMPSWF